MTVLGVLKRCTIFMVHSNCALSRSLVPCTTNVSGTVAFCERRFSKSRSPSCPGPPFTSSHNDQNIDHHQLDSLLIRKTKGFQPRSSNMGYFVIGVSGVTCGGKTTLTKLLLRKFPWAQVIHQDHYFIDDDLLNHLRVSEAENHVNYETLEALNMEKMYKDVDAILEAPPKFAKRPPSSGQQLNNGTTAGVGDKAETPNFDETFLQQIQDISYDVTKYEKVPILIIEGFTIFASQYLYDKCDARFFCSLPEETCRQRRLLRSYFPPDTPSYFDKVIWPEYVKHFENFIQNRRGVNVFDGNTLMGDLWRNSVQIITCRIEEKYGAIENDLESNVKA